MNRAYWDRLGKVWTICTGETKDVKPGMVLSDRQRSADAVSPPRGGFPSAAFHRCIIKGFDGKPLSRQKAALDLSFYNASVLRQSAGRRWRRSAPGQV